MEASVILDEDFNGVAENCQHPLVNKPGPR
jgi:hypothetical protein